MRVSKPAERGLTSLPTKVWRRAAGMIGAPAEEPRPPRCSKLAGADDPYRVRLGDCRLVCQVCAREPLVVIVGPRADVYARLKRRLR